MLEKVDGLAMYVKKEKFSIRFTYVNVFSYHHSVVYVKSFFIHFNHYEENETGKIVQYVRKAHSESPPTCIHI